MIRIAFLSFDWNYEIINMYYEGINNFVKEHDDVSVYIFHGFGKYDGVTPEKGTFEIYSLPNFKDFDGVIVQGNRVWPKDKRQEIVNKAIKDGCVVYSINYPLEGAHFVGTDNYSGLIHLTDHIIEKHNVNNLAYINGLETSVEANERKNGFIDSCNAHNISSYKIYPGGWTIEYGKNAASKIIADYGRNNLPGAIVCASDTVALGVLDVLENEGISVPEEVIVTGFDHSVQAIYSDVELTTIDRDYRGITYATMDNIYLQLKGFDVPNDLYSPFKLIASASCGCKTNGLSKKQFKSAYRYIDESLKDFYRKEDTLEPSMLQAESLSSLMDVIEDNYDIFHVEHIYVVMNDDYLETFENDKLVTKYGKHLSLMAIGGSTLDYSPNDNHIYTTLSKHELLPQQIKDTSRLFIFYPLRSGVEILGYVVFDGLSSIQRHNFHEIYFMLYSNAIESLRKKSLLEKLNGKLDDLYVRDSLTGFYNRFGLQRYGKRAYQRYLDEQGYAYFNFIDIDDMKHINDDYGHEQGDAAILETSGIIKIACSGEDCVMMRYGGDEFLIISSSSIKDKLEQTKLEMIKQNTNPFKLELSIGEKKITLDDNLTVEQSIEVADNVMYEVKKSHKVNR